MKDIQSEFDSRGVNIRNVGIKEYVRPVMVRTNTNIINTVAAISLSVFLESSKRGTHMSRFVEILTDWDGNISFENLQQILSDTKEKLQTNSANVVLKFVYFLTKISPITKKSSSMSYTCGIIMNSNDDYFTLNINIPISSTCPCSKSISKYGAHNQRGILSVKIRANTINCIDDLIRKSEKSCSVDLFSLVKREDEKYITEKSYENPKFVEDIARDMAMILKSDGKYKWYEIDVETFESIHNHNAYASVYSSDI